MIAVTTADGLTHYLEDEAAIATYTSSENTRIAIQAAHDAGDWEHHTPPEPEPLRTLPDPVGAAARALTVGTPEFAIFYWIREQANVSLPIASARADINANLGLVNNWQIDPAGMAQGLTVAFLNLASSADSNLPNGWHETIAQWRHEFGLAE